MQNTDFWDFTLCRSVLRLLVTVNISRSPNLVTLMVEATRSSGKSALTTTTRRNTREDSILFKMKRV
jgi:hypothetical protein